MTRFLIKAPVLTAALLSSARAVELLNEDFNGGDGGFVQEATGNTPIPSVYNSGAGTWSMEGDDSGPATNTLTSPAIAMATTGGIQVTFTHRFSIEAEWDGTAIQVSVDGGPFKTVPGTAFSQNSYTFSPLIGNHVLKDGEGFNGESPGYIDGDFITSVASAGGVPGGSTFQIRFLGAWDENTRGFGIPNWEIDSILVDTLPDTDGDGMPDSYEDANSLNKNLDDSAGDPDSDDSSNLDEFLNGTDPQDDDSDDDGLLDGSETNTGTYVSAADTGTDPLVADTDGDGLLDGVENPDLPYVDKSQTGSNPLMVDTDSDGFDDGIEVLAGGSDPGNAAARPLRQGLLDLIAYWDFNDDSVPGETADVVNGIVGTLLPGTADPSINTTFTADAGGRTGQPGDKAMDFGTLGANGTGVSVEFGEIFNIGATQNQFAVSFWQNRSGSESSSAFRALSPTSSDGQRGIGVHAPWGDGTIYFDTAGCCDGGRQRISGSAAVNFIGEWHHLVFQKNGDAKEVWVDGVLAVSGTNVAPLPLDFYRLIIGADQTQNTTGVIDDFAIFADALSPEEIAALANGDDPRSLVPSNDDTDGDNIPDAYELLNGLTVGTNDAAGDLDSDGADNYTEFLNGTNPQDDDSDDDGLKDGVETNTGVWVSINDTGSNPLNTDSDGDGLGDGVENPDLPYLNAAQPGTDPNLADTDGDTYDDANELAFGSDPSSAASFPEFTQELLVYYNFDGQSDDQTQNAGPASLEGGAVLTTGSKGLSGSGGDEALDLGEIGSGAAAVVGEGDHFALAEFNNAIAVSLWQFNTTVANSSAFWLISPTSGNNQRGFQAHTPWGNGTVYLDVAGQTAGAGRLTTNGLTITGQWQHFVFQKTENGDLEIWIDGALATSSAGAPDLLPFSGAFTIGAEGLNLNNTFHGRIDDFAVFSAPLTEEEIGRLAEGTTPDTIFGPKVPFMITSISYDPATDKTTLQWNSRPNRRYSIDSSPTLEDGSWGEILDELESDGDTTSIELPAGAGDPKLFFRVREL